MEAKSTPIALALKFAGAGTRAQTFATSHSGEALGFLTLLHRDLGAVGPRARRNQLREVEVPRVRPAVEKEAAEYFLEATAVAASVPAPRPQRPCDPARPPLRVVTPPTFAPQVTLDNNVAGRTRTGLVRYTSNAFANYTFPEGALRGFSIGGGAARTGRTYVSTIRNTFYYRGEQLTTSMRLGYTTRLRGIPVRLALNVENVLDDRDPIVSTFDGGYRDSNGVAIPNGFILRAPRTIKFSARFTF